MGKRKAVHECVAGRLYERLLDDGILDRSLHPSGIPREADRWKPLLHGGETAGVSPACRECDAQLATSMGTMNVDQMLHHLNLACGGSLASTIFPTKVT